MEILCKHDEMLFESQRNSFTPYTHDIEIFSTKIVLCFRSTYKLDFQNTANVYLNLFYKANILSQFLHFQENTSTIQRSMFMKTISV
jgi:hypothetical protein